MSEPTWRQAWVDGAICVDDLFDAIDARNAEIISLGARLDAVAAWPTVIVDRGDVRVEWKDGQTSARIDRALLDGIADDRNRMRALLAEALDGWRAADGSGGVRTTGQDARRITEIRREAGL